MKKYLILGSNSVTASYFINLLLKKNTNSIIGLSRNKIYKKSFLPFAKNENLKNFKFYQTDINKNSNKIFSIIDDFKPNYVINYAAQGEVRNSWKYPLDWYQTNIIANIRIIEYLKKNKYLKKYISISTPEVYGSNPNKISENQNYSPNTPYAISKLCADLHLNALYKKIEFPVIFTRTANIYGPYQQLYRIIPKTIINLKLDKKITLHGKGLAKRSFLHGYDAANFTLNAIKYGKIGEIYHCSTNETPINLISLVKRICKKMEKNFNKSVSLVDENFGQDHCYFLDNKKAINKLNWKPEFNLSSGIDHTIKWINENWNSIKKLNLEYNHQK